MTAHSRLFTNALAVALAVAASGCIFNSTTPASPGDVTFRWTFAGKTCAQTPEVSRIVIEMPGQTLSNNGVYNCETAGVAGIKLLNFRGGSYQYVVSAQNNTGLVIYQASGTVRVDGNVDVNVNLTTTNNTTYGAYVSWALPAGTPVTCQYIYAVDVSIDGAMPSVHNCVDGFGSNAVYFTGLTPGAHTIEISARDQAGLFYYSTGRVSFNVQTNNQGSAQTFSLLWLVGSVPVRWTFSNGTATLNCAQAGVSQVQVTLRDSQQQDTNFTVNCQDNTGAQATQIPYVYYGNYSLYVQATGAGNVLYRSNFNAPATVTVQAGVFPVPDSTTPLTLLTL